MEVEFTDNVSESPIVGSLNNASNINLFITLLKGLERETIATYEDNETTHLLTPLTPVDIERATRKIDYSNSKLLNFCAYTVGIVITGFNFILLYQIYMGVD